MADPLFDKDGNLSNVDELSKEEVATAYQEKNKSIFGRLTEEERLRKQAEADAAKAKKDLEEKSKPAEPPVVSPTQSIPTPEEIRIYATLAPELLEEAKKIAKGSDLTISQALETKAFKLLKADFEEEQRKEAAKLGASHGSGPGGSKPTVTPGMSKEDHQKVWREKMGLE